MGRGLIAFIAALVCLFQACVVVIGYADYGFYPGVGTTQKVDAAHARITMPSKEAAAAGVRAGDILEPSALSLEQRLAMFWTYWKPATVFHTPLIRNGVTVYADLPVAAVPVRWPLMIDVLIRLALVAIGFIILIRGAGTVGLWGGISLVSLALQQGYAFNFGSVPLAIGLTAFAIQSIAYIPTRVGRYYFADALLQERGRTVPRAFTVAFVTCLSLLAAALVLRRYEGLSGFDYFDSYALFQGTQLIDGIYFIALMGYVAFNARSDDSLRVLFWATVLGWSGVTFNQVLGIFNITPLFGGLANLTYVFYALGVGYAVFAKNLVSVNFYVSRAVIYAVVLAIIVGAFVALEHVIEKLTVGEAPSIALQLLVPLGLGLSFRYIERFAERVVERTLYRDRLCAEEQIEALIGDFPHARSVTALEQNVVADVARLLHATSVGLYRESELGYQPVATTGASLFRVVGADERAFLRLRSTLKPVTIADVGSDLPGIIAFPLVVVGQLTGALVVGPRKNGEPYDPDEVALLSRLAHELAVTLLWAEREPLRVPALDG